MRRRTTFVIIGGLLLLAACTRTVIVRPAPETERPAPPGPSTAATLDVPPGHLPDPGECRIWIPGTPPGRQPRPRSRPCAGIAAYAPAGSWIIYRPTEDRRLVHVRVVDERRAGVVIRIRIFDIVTERLVREEEPQDEARQNDRPREEHPREPRPPEARPREERPRGQPPAEKPLGQRPEVQPPVENKPPPPGATAAGQPAARGAAPPPPHGPSTAAALDVPPGQLPELGECRVWIPGTPPGQQPRPTSRPCEGIAASAPAGSWIIYRPTEDKQLVHVRLVDERRAGVVIRIRIFNIDTRQLVREEHP